MNLLKGTVLQHRQNLLGSNVNKYDQHFRNWWYFKGRHWIKFSKKSRISWSGDYHPRQG